MKLIKEDLSNEERKDYKDKSIKYLVAASNKIIDAADLLRQVILNMEELGMSEFDVNKVDSFVSYLYGLADADTDLDNLKSFRQTNIGKIIYKIENLD